jgi:hypothetical protein
MPCKDFIKEYVDVHSKTFKSTTIITAFQKSSRWPVNCNVFTDEDYTPGIPMSTSFCHIPSSFPVGIQDLDDKSDDKYPAYPMENPHNSESDDELSDDDANDAIKNSENLGTNTLILPAASQPLSTPMVSHHPPVTLPCCAKPHPTHCSCVLSSSGACPTKHFLHINNPAKMEMCHWLTHHVLQPCPSSTQLTFASIQ